MATELAERPKQRRQRGWLRRIEPQTPLRLPITRLSAESSSVLVPCLELGEHDGFRSFLNVEPATPATAVLVPEEPQHIACGFGMGPGGTVALDAVDAKRAARRATPRRSTAVVRGRRPNRPTAPPKLSLSERLLLVLQPPLESLLEPAGVLEWPFDLRPYQHEGVRALFESNALLLADDMGLGKTIQAIAAVRALVHLRRVEQAVIVAPASILSQWRRELELWAPELRTEVIRGSRYDRVQQWRKRSHLFIVSYETLRQDVDPEARYGPSAIDWDVVVLDEAQKIKNPATQTARACKSLPRRRAWALTGTPLENSFDDLGSVVQFLTPLTRTGKLPPLLGGEKLLQKHADLQLRRRKADVLTDLPPKSVNDLWIHLTEGQRRTYDRAEREGVVMLRNLGEEITIANVLALIQRLKQICNVCPDTGDSAKLEDLGNRLGEIAAEDQRALVFSQYVSPEYGVRAIVEHLTPLHPLAYHGGLSAREKDDVVDRFKNGNGSKALVLSLRAGGQGLNLQEASYVFHFDRWWNPAVERQAEDRTHRIGQKNAVTVYRYICENTIEERIDRILKDKQALFDQYVDKVSIDPGKLLGEKEIFGLFGLEPPSRGGGGDGDGGSTQELDA